MEAVSFENMREDDLPKALDIYNHYVITSTATFHPAPISMESFREFIFLDHRWYKAYMIYYMAEIAGFCFLTQYKKHISYDRTAELGVYLEPEVIRKGLGSKAVRHLEKVAAENGLKMIVASISGENLPSIEMFKKLDYELCGHFRRIGEKWGRPMDVVFFQKSLENVK